MLRPFNVAFTAMPVVLFDARVGLLTGSGDATCRPHGARPSTIASAEPTAVLIELDALQQTLV